MQDSCQEIEGLIETNKTNKVAKIMEAFDQLEVPKQLSVVSLIGRLHEQEP